MKRATFIYGKGDFVSGQSLASELVIAGLRERGWRIDVITILLLDRMQKSDPRRVGRLLVLACRLLVAWCGGLGVALGSRALYVNLGQTRFALLRDGLPLLVKGLFARDGRAVISLHGSLFLDWGYRSLEARLLRRILRAARYVTVLGERQKQALVRLGIPAEKIIWIDNTCELVPMTASACVRKHEQVGDQPIRVLYLGNLLETKGYPEYVQAIAQLARTVDFPVEAVLCGSVLNMDGDALFATHEQARAWIESQVSEVNASARVQLRWIGGAFGSAKEELFRAAHVFCLPTRYPVEAQPLTILEALAAGCAIVSTGAGEIPSTVSEETAILLEDGTPESIAQAIATLCRDADRRKALALNGLQLFQRRFSFQQHIDRWERLLKSAS
jgi:glycosyltransferase involved in cell wall biosynthesis